MVAAVLSRLPHARPDAAALAGAKIVSHRGEHRHAGIKENTFAAFDPAVAAGVAAIELDIRYTRDDEPVVIHDADLKRVFGVDALVAETRWSELSRLAPELPHLDTLIEHYQARAHLMIELKTRGSARAEQRLADSLRPLQPVTDFHLLALDPDLFTAANTLPATCHLPVAKFNCSALYAWALAHDCAGLAGPYALMRKSQIRALRRTRGFVGSGFVDTPALLLRELSRGIDWVFSNRAVDLQQALDAARARAGASA